MAGEPSDLDRWLRVVRENHARWESSFEPFDVHPSLHVDPARVDAALSDLAARLEENYPFFHPTWAGQMLKPGHPIALAGYLAAALVNPNNHSIDSSPATSYMEREAVAALAAMFGLPQHLGHLTSSGTIANLEALFVARQSHPDKAVAYSEDAHYTHSRMCHVLGIEGVPVRTDGRGRIDLDEVERLAREGRIGTVVLTAGSTGLGTVDRIEQALAIRERHGLRIHVDAAYGGFFAILGRAHAPLVEPEPWEAMSEVDSIVVDPHKHGLQPYGCGAVIFRDPTVADFYLHDSPYTYFTHPGELHLGEISLECSRAGASAAALWLTLQLFPLTMDGMGAVLAATRRGALRWTSLIEQSEELALYQPTELDIVSCYPSTPGNRLSEIDAATCAVLQAGMDDAHHPVYLSVLTTSRGEFLRRHPAVVPDAEKARIFRSVMMKPEHEQWADEIHERVTALVRKHA